jgi:hypothetical protein
VANRVAGCHCSLVAAQYRFSGGGKRFCAGSGLILARIALSVVMHGDCAALIICAAE